MNNLRLLRDSYRLTIHEVARRTALSLYRLERFEQGRATLNAHERAKLAHFFGVPDTMFCTTPVSDPRTASTTRLFLSLFRRRTLLLLLLTGVLAFGVLHPWLSPASRARTYFGGDDYRPIVVTELPLSILIGQANQANQTSTSDKPQNRRSSEWATIPTLSPLDVQQLPEVPTPTPAAIPAAIAIVPAAVAPATTGPGLCPLQPTGGRVAITQPYGVGTHVPVSVWGAIDLGVDANGDGFAEPGSSNHTPVIATHSGVAWVTLGSWPGGNVVTLVDGRTGWRTNYAHLDHVLVSHGQAVHAGTPLGVVGSTGMTTGPHLDYQVWYGGANQDPTPFLGACW